MSDTQEQTMDDADRDVASTSIQEVDQVTESSTTEDAAEQEQSAPVNNATPAFTKPEQVQQPVVAKPVTSSDSVGQSATTLEQANALAKTTGGKIILQQIGDYMNNMRPGKPITAEEGSRHQVSLYRAITNTVNNLDEDFKLIFSTLLKLFDEHKDGVFHEMYVFRFMEHIQLSETDRKGFQRLLRLIRTTANPKGRDIALRQVDLVKITEFGVSEIGKQRIMQFYGK